MFEINALVRNRRDAEGEPGRGVETRVIIESASSIPQYSSALPMPFRTGNGVGGDAFLRLAASYNESIKQSLARWRYARFMTNRVAIRGACVCRRVPDEDSDVRDGVRAGKRFELEVGHALLAAARAHEVWVLTNKESIPVGACACQSTGSGTNSSRRYRFRRRRRRTGAADDSRLSHRHYDRWQRNAAARAVELDRQVDFDVVHHVTLAAYWTRAGVAVLEKPLVWGPVGGGVEPPSDCSANWGFRAASKTPVV